MHHSRNLGCSFILSTTTARGFWIYRIVNPWRCLSYVEGLQEESLRLLDQLASEARVFHLVFITRCIHLQFLEVMLGCPWRTCLCLFANSVATRGDSKSSSCRMSNRGIVPSLGTAHEAQDQESQTSNCTGCQMRVCHMTKLCQSDGVSRVSCASSLEIRRGCMSKDIPTGIGLRALLAVQFTLWYCTLQARQKLSEQRFLFYKFVYRKCLPVSHVWPPSF